MYKKLLSTIVCFLCLARVASALPWSAGAGTGTPLQVSGATPTCTYTATALACIENMTANVTSLTLAGMTAGTYYTLVWMQDGTGSRTLTQTPITAGSAGTPALTTGTTGANKYDVWLIKATSASAATFEGEFANAPLWSEWTTGGGIAGTAVAVAGTTTVSALPSVVVPGMTASNVCTCTEQAVVGVNTALTTQCVPNTNFVQCNWKNASAASVTATTATFNVRIWP